MELHSQTTVTFRIASYLILIPKRVGAALGNTHSLLPKQTNLAWMTKAQLLQAVHHATD